MIWKGGLEIQGPFLPLPSLYSTKESSMTNPKANPLIKDVMFFLAAIVVSMAGFWMMTGRDLINRDEASLLIQQQTISLETKVELYYQGLLQQEERIVKQEEKLQRILEQNTEAINDLKVQIATLSQSLKSITESGGTQ